MIAGKSLGDEMGQRGYRFVPIIVPRMVKVGEKSGNLDQTLLYLADFFEEEVDDKVRNLGSIIEPMMLVVIAVVVGFVAMAIISPIYQLTGGVHR